MMWMLACAADPAAPDPAAPDPAPSASAPGFPIVAEAEGGLHVALTADERDDGYAYNGQVPGPTLRARVGDVLTVDLQNDLADATTIHWHGVAAPAAMDGVEWMTAPVAAGGAFTYTIPLATSGTFWYHPHVDTDHQVDLGLYGAIVVEDPAEPVADRDIVMVFDASDEVAEEEHDEHDEHEDDEHDDEHGHVLLDPAASVWTVNGEEDPTLSATGGERIRVRMINAANTSYLDLGWPGLRRIGGDQGLLAAADAPERVLLAPGDRGEFEWLVGEDGFEVTTLPWVPAGGGAWGDERRLLSVEVEAPAAAPAPLDWAFDGAQPSEDPAWTDLVYVFSGGDEEWLINGEAWPDVTISTAPLGEPTILEIRNLSATEHPFHLHGNAVEVLSVDGVPPAVRTIEDTVNVGIRGTLRLRLVPTNPGDWMLHCHLLGHEVGGMMTVLRVE